MTARLAAVVVLFASLLPASELTAQQGFQQSVMGPGLYVFQTRIDSATCGDADRTGDVTSYFAAIDGVPGSLSMRMSLLNSRFWPDWTVSITADGHISGDAQQAGVTGPDRGVSHFDVTANGPRFTGQGAREYSRTVNGTAQRCRVVYDALLRRIDT